jgi:hypothetical protein
VKLVEVWVAVDELVVVVVVAVVFAELEVAYR